MRAARETLARVLDQGYVCLPALLGDPWLESLHQAGEMGRLIERAGAQHQLARDVFLSAEGDRLLQPRSSAGE